MPRETKEVPCSPDQCERAASNERGLFQEIDSFRTLSDPLRRRSQFDPTAEACGHGSSRWVPGAGPDGTPTTSSTTESDRVPLESYRSFKTLPSGRCSP